MNAVLPDLAADSSVVGDPAGPQAGVVDPANDTLYTANFGNAMSAFDLRHCNAADLAWLRHTEARWPAACKRAGPLLRQTFQLAGMSRDAA